MGFELVVVGTGFASTFFLLRWLRERPESRVLVLERGQLDTHAWRLQHRDRIDRSGVLASTDFGATFVNRTPEKPWVYTPAVGGSSNCWYGCTPRLLPNDFR